MHYYEKNIVDIKTEYTNFLLNIMAPLVYEGIKSMYDRAIDVEKETEQQVLNGTVNENPGVLKIFQHFLKNIQTLNSQLIEAEMIRIRDGSKHADIFEKLIRATFKSYIILLTYNASGKECKLVTEKFHDRIVIKDFIHKVYVEAAKNFFLNPELFWHQYSTLEQQKNKRDAINIIKEAIKEALIKVLPMNDILTEYLHNDYIIETEEIKEQKVRNILMEEENINYFNDNDDVPKEEQIGGDDNELMTKLNKSVSKLDEIIDHKKVEEHIVEQKEYEDKMNRFATLDFGGDKKNTNNITKNNDGKNNDANVNANENDDYDIRVLKPNINEKEYYDALFA